MTTMRTTMRMPTPIDAMSNTVSGVFPTFESLLVSSVSTVGSELLLLVTSEISAVVGG